MAIINIEETAEGLAIRGMEERVENPFPFLNQVGLIVVADSQKHFRDQEFDGIPWPERYPNQEGPKLNIAGALTDAAAGRSNPLARRFRDRPAGIDTGNLRRSVTYRIEGTDVIAGSTAANAQITQEGGRTAINVTSTIRNTINQWLKRAGRAVRNLKKGGTESEIHADIARWESTGGPESKHAAKLKRKLEARATKLVPAQKKLSALDRLRFVFFKHKGTSDYKYPIKVTTVNARPFIGATDTVRKKIIAWGARWFSTGEEA